jgi:hypothetical protein
VINILHALYRIYDYVVMRTAVEGTACKEKSVFQGTVLSPKLCGKMSPWSLPMTRFHGDKFLCVLFNS